MMSKERELLKECRLILDTPFNGSTGINLRNRITELLAQPEQDLEVLKKDWVNFGYTAGRGEALLTRAPNQDIISDIEYLITAFTDGADADDYWRPISELRDDLNTLKGQVHVQQILEAFPLLEDEDLDQESHHCEWALQQDRKRLHTMLSTLLPPKREPLSDTKCPYPEETSGEYRDGFTDGILYAEEHHGIGVDNE